MEIECDERLGGGRQGGEVSGKWLEEDRCTLVELVGGSKCRRVKVVLRTQLLFERAWW